MALDKRDRINYLIIFGLILIALCGFAAWFITNFELVEKETRSNMSKEARQNPFLAAELFLRKAGANVESVSGRERLHKLPSTDDILLINNFGPNLSPNRHQALLDWIKAGGHLITTAHKTWDEDKGKSGDQLLDELGIRLYSRYQLSEESESDFDSYEEETEEIVINRSERKPTEVEFNSGEIVKVNFDPNYVLTDEDERASVYIDSDYGTHLMQVPLGNGLVTIMSDNRFMKNPMSLSFFGDDLEWSRYFTSIANEDHAYYLWLLLGTENKIWLLYSLETDGLATLLWRNAKAACLTAIALLLVWLLWQRNRFGPHIIEYVHPRRNLLEHIHMAANFSWRQDKGQRLFRKNREQFLNFLAHKHPQIMQLSEQEKSQRLAELSNLSVEKIHHALFGDWNTEREFIQLTHTLQTLRNTI